MPDGIDEGMPFLGIKSDAVDEGNVQKEHVFIHAGDGRNVTE